MPDETQAGNALSRETGGAQDLQIIRRELAAARESLQQQTELNSVWSSLAKILISPGISVEQVRQTVLEHAKLLTKSECGLVSSLDSPLETQGGAAFLHTQSHEVMPVLSVACPADQDQQCRGLWGHALHTREAFFTNQPMAHPAWENLAADPVQLRNFLAVPAMYGNELLGQIAVANSGRDYHDAELETVVRLGELYAAFLQNRRLEKALSESEQRFRAMVEAAPFPLAVTRLADHLIRYLNLRAARLFAISPEKAVGENAFRFYVHPKERVQLVEQVLSKGMVADREMELCNAQGKPFWALTSVIQIEWDGEPAILCALYDITGRKRMEEELKHLAITDYLTGLWNRRQFMAQGAREFERLQRYQSPFTLIIFDLDHFKRVNDSYGHDSGDRVLSGTAQVVRDNLRSVDIACRFGGEEFAILLPETSLPYAMHVGERIRGAIAAHPFALEGGEVVSVTASFGVAEGLPGDQTFPEVIKKADRALYQAKEAGRDRVLAGT